MTPVCQGLNSSSPMPASSLFVSLPRRDGEHLFEDLGSDLVERGAVEHPTCVHVHVGLLHAVELRVRGDLDRRRGLEPEARAATGREHDDRAAARDLARHGDGVVARRVHVHESAPRDPLGVPDDLIERCRAGLRDRAERLLVDRRQAAGLVPGRWIVVDRGTEGRRMPLPPPDALEELARDLRAARSAREQMLSTVDLGGLAEDDRSPLAHLDPRASWSLLFRRALRTRCTGSSPHPPGREGWRRHDAPAPGRRPGRCPR